MSLVIFYTSTRLRVFLQEILFFVLISWFGVCLFKVPETESKQVEPCDLWLTEYFFANKCVMTTNWKEPASVLRSPFALPARIVASIVESRGLPWRGKLLFDLTSQLPAKLQSSTSASSTLQHKQSHTLCLSEKANMNHGEEITTLFGLSFLAADGIPIMSPWKSWSFLSDHLRADNSVHQQHLLPQSPPSVLAALGFYSRNFLHHILSPRKGMVRVSAGQWAHSAYQLMLRSLQLFCGYISTICSLDRAHDVAKPGVPLCWRTVSRQGKTGRLPRPADALLRPCVQHCCGAELCHQCTCSERRTDPPGCTTPMQILPWCCPQYCSPRFLTSWRYGRGRA